MDPLLSIENRLEELECKLGYSPELTFTKTASELYNEVETNLNATLTARESINAINKRLDELNNYLDPQYVNQINDSKLKVHYLLSNAAGLAHFSDSMVQCQEKSKVLDAMEMPDIPELDKKLQDIKEAFIDIQSQCDQVEQCVMQAMETCNSVFIPIMEHLAAVHSRVEALEGGK